MFAEQRRNFALMNSPTVALTIAGSDNSAGAGAQADLKTFGALGVYGLTAITCVVAEVPGKVSAIQPITPDIVREQIRLCFAAYPVAAVKTGMLFSSEIMAAVADALSGRRLPLVVDPVMIATSGSPLLQPDAIAVYGSRLFPLATVLTPNLDEAAVLLGAPITDAGAMREAGAELLARFGVPCLLKGGHLRTGVALDLLFERDRVSEFTAPFVPGVSTHGTGCTYAASIAAGLAKGLTLHDAVGAAKIFVTRAITNFFRWQGDRDTTDALNHLS
jgi:hydroxymethylpyrimidine/phosphomethylpyrimidine kinase